MNHQEQRDQTVMEEVFGKLGANVACCENAVTEPRRLGVMTVSAEVLAGIMNLPKGVRIRRIRESPAATDPPRLEFIIEGEGLPECPEGFVSQHVQAELHTERHGCGHETVHFDRFTWDGRR